MFALYQQLARRAALLIGISALAGSAMAQQAPGTIRLLPEDAQRGANGHQHNFYFLPPGVGGEDYQNAGFFGQKLRPYLTGNEDALKNLNSYRRQKTLFLIDRLVAVGAIGVYGQQVLAHTENEQYFNNTQKVAAGVFVTSLLATVFINQRTNQHFQRAVSAYNAGKPQTSVWPQLRPTTMGLGWTAGQPTLALSWSVR
jgi:hypothetical protein